MKKSYADILLERLEDFFIDIEEEAEMEGYTSEFNQWRDGVKNIIQKISAEEEEDFMNPPEGREDVEL